MIPTSFKPYLWSYDFDNLDKENHKKIIVTQVLNLGSLEAVKDLFHFYSKKDIQSCLRDTKPTTFNKRSYNFWTKVL